MKVTLLGWSVNVQVARACDQQCSRPGRRIRSQPMSTPGSQSVCASSGASKKHQDRHMEFSEES